MILNKVNKMIGPLRKFHNILPKSALLIIDKDFVISIAATLFTTKLMIKLFIRNWNWYNTVLAMD